MALRLEEVFGKGEIHDPKHQVIQKLAILTLTIAK